MFALRQIVEDPGDFIPVPPEVKHKRTEVIFLVADTIQKTDMDAPSGQVQDPGIAEFFGCIPDFPERDPQGEYEQREPIR